jgi:lipocalin
MGKDAKFKLEDLNGEWYEIWRSDSVLEETGFCVQKKFELGNY